jgi:urea transport system substrate-binding protein
MTLTRRSLMKSGAAAALAAGLPMPFIRSAAAADEIVIASLYDLSGAFQETGKQMYDTLTLAVGDINKSRGLLGKQIKVVAYDLQSNLQVSAQYAQQAALRDRVAVVHGGISSASREVMRPILDKYKTLYFYDTPYEGGVCDRNTFCVSTTPSQTVSKLISYACKTWGRKGYILAADYNYGQITSDWVKKFAKNEGGEILGTEFFPFDVTNFGSTLAKIQAAEPDWVVTVLVGGTPLAFYRQFAAAGLNKKIHVCSTTFGSGNEQAVLTASESDGIVVCYNYMETIDNAQNVEFLKRFHAKFGDKYPPLSELPMSSYQGVQMWAAAVRKAGSVDRMKVIQALEDGITLDMPSGKFTMDGVTHHCTQDVHLAVYQDKVPKIVETFAAQAPLDTAAVCDLAKNPNDNRQYVIKVN